MAHLWTPDDSGEWTPTRLDHDAFALLDGALQRASASLSEDEAPTQLLLRRLSKPPNTWALLTTQPGVRVNGSPVPLGIALLDDRDEIRLPGFTAWFSTETQAQVEPFPEATARGFCPRCKQTIEAATPAVRCPGCGLWHHASDDLPCWTYAPTCAACAQDTALDAGFGWTPEEL